MIRCLRLRLKYLTELVRKFKAGKLNRICLLLKETLFSIRDKQLIHQYPLNSKNLSMQNHRKHKMNIITHQTRGLMH